MHSLGHNCPLLCVRLWSEARIYEKLITSSISQCMFSWLLQLTVIPLHCLRAFREQCHWSCTVGLAHAPQVGCTVSLCQATSAWLRESKNSLNLVNTFDMKAYRMESDITMCKCMIPALRQSTVSSLHILEHNQGNLFALQVTENLATSVGCSNCAWEHLAHIACLWGASVCAWFAFLMRCGLSFISTCRVTSHQCLGIVLPKVRMTNLLLLRHVAGQQWAACF